MIEERRTKFMTVGDLKREIEKLGSRYDDYTVLGVEKFVPHSTGVVCLNDLQEERRTCVERPRRY